MSEFPFTHASVCEKISERRGSVMLLVFVRMSIAVSLALNSLWKHAPITGCPLQSSNTPVVSPALSAFEVNNDSFKAASPSFLAF